MTKNFGVGGRRTGASGWGTAAAVGCLMVLAGWTGAAAQEQGCNWVQAFCPGISWDNVEKSVSGVIMYQATNGQAPQDRCLFIGGAKGDMNFNSTTSGHLVNGAAPTNSFFNAATFNAQAKKDGGYYVFLKSSTQVWAQFDVNQATQGTPTLCSSNYTVTWNADGGTPVPTQTTVSSGSSITQPAAMTKTGYTFGGWFTNATLTTQATFPITNVTANTTLYAKWTINSYTVTWNADGGTPVPTQISVNHGASITQPAAMTKAGYTFGGWFTNATLTTQATFPIANVTANTTLYAKWTATATPTYTVTWNADGGTPVPTQTSVDQGGSITQPAAMTKAGYTFGGWFTNATLTTAASFPVTNVTENKTFYAKWTATATPTYTVTWNADGGTPVPTQTSVDQGGSITQPAAMTKAGYTFGGWFTNATLTTAASFPVTNVTANMTFYAKWTAAAPTTYIITFNAGSGAVTPASAPTNADGTLSIELPVPIWTGYNFGGWETLDKKDVTQSTVFTAATTIYARWTSKTPDSFTITFDANGGSVSPPSLPTGADGTLSSLPTPTRSGFKFEGWFTTQAATGGTQVTISYPFTADATIYARWSVSSFTITFNANGGSVTPASDVTDADGFLTNNLPTPNRPGWNFEGWFTAADGGTEVNMGTQFTADATIYAHWTEIPSNSFTITFNANGGTVTPGTGVTDEDGYLITSLPEPDERSGYRFDGWFTAANGGTEVAQNHKFSGNTTIYAHWTAAPTIFKITFDAGGGEVSPASANTGEDSTLASLPTPTYSGYSFEGWYTAASGGGDKVTASYKFSSSITVYALWTAASRNIAEIDAVLFLDAQMIFSFTVIYHLTDANSGHTLRYEVLDSASADVLFGSETNLAIKASKEGDKDTLSIPIATPLFDTTYLIRIYTVDANGLPGEKKSEKSVKSGNFEHQKLSIPFGSIDSVNNGNFKLAAVGSGWYNTSGPSVNMIVNAADAPSESAIKQDGFISVSSYGYKYTVTNTPNDMYLFGAFKISMRANVDIPPPYSPEDVKLYRWDQSAGYWEVVFDTKFEDGYFTGTAVSTVEDDNNKTYRLMINTLGGKPTVTTTSYLDVVNSDELITASYTVRSNVGNYMVKLLSGPAKGADPLPETALGVDTLTDPRSRKVSFTIPVEVVRSSVNRGVLAFIVVNDGSAEYAENVSYRVKSDKYGGFPVDPVPKKWLPFAAQVELENKSVKTALRRFYQEGDSFTVYDTLYRLYRWYETAENRRDKSKWVEYNGNNDTTFDMKPTNLMWFKTSVASVISELDFGGATSVPLRDTFDIKLPPGQWTDLVLPFGFNVCLGDILDATAGVGGTSNLEFYRWKEPAKKQKYSYLVEPLVLATADSSSELDGGEDPFTVYNPGASDVILRIPPKPAFMSRYNAANKKKAAQGLAKTAAGTRQATDAAWHYTLNATADDSELSSVLVGYSATERAFAVPPSFSNESVVLVSDDGTEIGHHFGPSITNGGTYKLRFYNDGRQRTVFTFSAKPSDNAPVNARITFVRASNGEILGGGSNSEQSITVAGMSHEDVFMIVGNSVYRAKAAATAAGAKFAVGRISVNKAARSARISYYVPASGVSQVEASIYDIKGRQVWRSTQKAIAASWNTTEWNSRGSRRGAASTGLYVVRVKAIGANGRPVGVDTKRIMFAR